MFVDIGVMPDGTVRFKDKDGKDIFHFMGYVKSVQFAGKFVPNMHQTAALFLFNQLQYHV
jgi:thioredoxin-related protein